jgi:hypothetical protein
LNALDKKKGEEERATLKFICLLIEILDDSTLFASKSKNKNAKKGIRIERVDGTTHVWNIQNTTLKSNLLEIISFVLVKVDTELAKVIDGLVKMKNATSESVCTKLRKYVNKSIKSESGYFVARLTTRSSSDSILKEYIEYSPPSTSTNSLLKFEYQRFTKEDKLISTNEISWSCSPDMRYAIQLFFNTLEGYSLRGDLVEVNLNSFLKMCSVMHTSLDPSLLKSHLDQLRGFRTEDVADVEEDGETDDDDAETGEEENDDGGIDLANPEHIKNLLLDDILGCFDNVLYNVGSPSKKTSRNTRDRNALATMSQNDVLFTRDYGFKGFGAHVDWNYAQKHLKIKFQTEIKSFITCGNSSFRFAPTSNL